MKQISSTLLVRLRIGFLLSALLLLLSTAASYYSIQQLIYNSEWVNHTYDVLLHVKEIEYKIREGESNQRAYILTNSTPFLDTYNESYPQTIQIYNRLKTITQDNPVQQKNLEELKQLLENRFNQFELVLNAYRSGKVSDSLIDQKLLEGKRIMEQLSGVSARIETHERQLLALRTEAQSTYIGYTPVLIIIAALISMTITGLSYVRIKNDVERRIAQQEEDEARYSETAQRIALMEDITRQIAAGDYNVRSYDLKEDEIGRISAALNQMVTSLEGTFTELETQTWLQSGMVSISDAMRGKTDLKDLAQSICRALAMYLDVPVAALYVMKDSQQLELQGGYALSHAPEHISPREGLIGQAATENRIVSVDQVPEEYIRISSSLGSSVPAFLTLVPVILPGFVRGVIELGSFRKLTDQQLQLLQQNQEPIAISLQGALSNTRLQELYSETQAQSEELQMQHRELETANMELEVHTQKLRTSEEELKVQQEELQQANMELEERSRQLEETNQLIIERNIEIQRNAEELAQSTRYKSEFLANMSHELRTPLNSILLLSRLLSENNEHTLTTDQVEYSRVIYNSGQGLLSLIDEILDLSKIESGKMELEYTSVDMDEIVQDLRSLFQPVAQEKQIAFDIHVAPEVPAHMETDKMRLEQILKNLISNAMKFTAQGSVKLLIRVPESRSQVVSFAVQDTGIGIPEEKHQLIFEAFQQADGSTRRKFGGTGLGLSISRELTRLLGGEIRVYSEVGKGSEFAVDIPLLRSAATEIRQVASKAVQEPVMEAPKMEAVQRFTTAHIPESIPDDRTSVQPDDKVILIVEDDTAFARSLLDFTRKKGYKGILSVRGDEGLLLARQYKPIGILLDIQLPVKDGWEVMAELKADAHTRHIPVHIMSSYEVKKESLRQGAINFINKPVAFDQMQDVFQKLEYVIHKKSKKVLIVEENPRHARALAFFLENFAVSSEISTTLPQGMEALSRTDVDCVILDMGIPAQQAYEMLETVKKSPGMEDLPIIIFTGKHLSKAEEAKIKQYADSIVVKTAHSYQRILDEVSLFLHLVEENAQPKKQPARYKRMGDLTEVLTGKKILITDDDVRNIFSLSKALEVYKMEVFSAIDGKDALRQLEEHPDIDVVLMDMMMPEMDGYEAMQRIRQQYSFRNLPIIAVTAKAMMGDRERCIQAGASDYISKPVDTDQLLSLLRVWLYDRSVGKG